MLILTRKKDEVIVINGTIKVRIVDIKSDGVRVGIEAPKTVKVYRQELWDNIQAENIKAVEAVEEAKEQDHMEVATKVGEKIKTKVDIEEELPPEN